MFWFLISIIMIIRLPKLKKFVFQLDFIFFRLPKARKLDFFVNVFYNDLVFEDLIILLKKLNISIWDWVFFLFQKYKS